MEMKIWSRPVFSRILRLLFPVNPHWALRTHWMHQQKNETPLKKNIFVLLILIDKLRSFIRLECCHTLQHTISIGFHSHPWSRVLYLHSSHTDASQTVRCDCKTQVLGILFEFEKYLKALVAKIYQSILYWESNNRMDLGLSFILK